MYVCMHILRGVCTGVLYVHVYSVCVCVCVQCSWARRGQYLQIGMPGLDTCLASLASSQHLFAAIPQILCCRDSHCNLEVYALVWVVSASWPFVSPLCLSLPLSRFVSARLLSFVSLASFRFFSAFFSLCLSLSFDGCVQFFGFVSRSRWWRPSALDICLPFFSLISPLFLFWFACLLTVSKDLDYHLFFPPIVSFLSPHCWEVVDFGPCMVVAIYIYIYIYLSLYPQCMTRMF